MKTQTKIVSLQVLKRRLNALRADGKVIAFTNGCFDILHWGHVSYLEAIKKKNRVLVLGLNSDKSIRSIKGPMRPIVSEQERARVMAGLACVDFVVMFEEDTPESLIKSLRPDILAKGSDWKGKRVAGQDWVKKVEFITYLDNLSTTNIINKIEKQCKKK